MKRPRKFLGNKGTDRLNLLIRYGNAFAAHAHNPENSICAVHSQALFIIFKKYSHEHIATEQRKLHFLLTIAPAMYCRDQWKKSGEALFLESFRHYFLVTCPRLYRVPFGLRRFCDGKRRGRLPNLFAATHSFAL